MTIINPVFPDNGQVTLTRVIQLMPSYRIAHVTSGMSRHVCNINIGEAKDPPATNPPQPPPPSPPPTLPPPPRGPIASCITGPGTPPGNYICVCVCVCVCITPACNQRQCKSINTFMRRLINPLRNVGPECESSQSPGKERALTCLKGCHQIVRRSDSLPQLKPSLS